MLLVRNIFLLVVIHVAKSTDDKPSTVYYVGGVGNSSLDADNDLTRANILSETKPLEKPEITPPAFENNLNDLETGTVYYEREKNITGSLQKKHKTKPKRKKIEKEKERKEHGIKPKRKKIEKEKEKKEQGIKPKRKEIEKSKERKEHGIKPKRKEIEKSKEKKEDKNKPKRKEVEEEQEQRTEPETASHKVILKSSPLNTTRSSSVGEGLDLTKANILHHRSSPAVVKSCSDKPITLKCAAEGNPAPDFTWYKGKTPVDKQRVAEFDLDIAPSSFVRASHLTLTPKNKEDFADYQCMANNNLGSSQQSIYKIKLEEKGKNVCKMMEDEKRKYNSIILGTFLSVGMLVAMLFVAGFVFWRLNLKDTSEYQGLKDCKDGNESDMVDDQVFEAVTSSDNAEDVPKNGGEIIEGSGEDFYALNAQEIGRLSSVLAADWERLARLLGFHQHDVDSMRQNSTKIESRCAEMLNKYRKNNGRREALAETVEELKDIETAEAIRKMYYKFNPTQ